MNKLVFAFAVCLVLFAVAEARCPSQCRRKDSTPAVCVRDRRGVMCRKMRECRMREENCRLRLQGRPSLTQTSRSQCSKIGGREGTGRCARRSIAHSKLVVDCNRIPCTRTKQRGRGCWRSRAGTCQLLTQCQGQRENCRRTSKNQLRLVARQRCAGMKAGAKPRRCK